MEGLEIGNGYKLKLKQNNLINIFTQPNQLKFGLCFVMLERFAMHSNCFNSTYVFKKMAILKCITRVNILNESVTVWRHRGNNNFLHVKMKIWK